MRVLRRGLIGVGALALSTMQVWADGGQGWADGQRHGGGHGSGGHGVPEIDATAGIAAIAVLLTIGMIIYTRSRAKLS